MHVFSQMDYELSANLHLGISQPDLPRLWKERAVSDFNRYDGKERQVIFSSSMCTSVLRRRSFRKQI